MLDKLDVVTWNCRACMWAITCDWHERNDVQDCPECGCKQYVPGSAFAWNARMFSDREEKRRAAAHAHWLAEDAEQRAREAEAQRRRETAEAAQRAQEAEAQRRREATEAAHSEKVRQHQLALDRLAHIAIGAGLIENKEAFYRLDEAGVLGVQALSDCADLLYADLMSALDDNVLAEKGVAYGRPAAAGASVVSLLAGYGWAGLAFGAVAVSARWLSNDWKRAQMAEYQAKWAKLFSRFSASEMRAFTAVFAYKYPALASLAAGFQGRIPM